MLELPQPTYEEICRLCALGDEHADEERFTEALSVYWAAWDLLPEPKTQWEAATWILAAIGDANFFGGDFVAGRDNLALAMHCPDAIGNPFLHLRLGQCQYEWEIYKGLVTSWRGRIYWRARKSSQTTTRNT